MEAHQRPLSPHLQVYRLPLTALLSIAHRFTGVILGMGALGLAILLVAAAMGEASYAAVHGAYTSLLGQLVLWLFVYSLFFHLCNGIRHLIWDGGYALDLRSVDLGATLVLVISVLLTLLVMAMTTLTAGSA